MVVGEIPEFFQFPKHEFSTARCKCTIYIITYKGIKVVIRTKLPTWQFYFPCGLFFSIVFFFLHEAEFNYFSKEIVLVIRNGCITMSEVELFCGELSFGAVNLCFRCSYLKIVFHSNLQSVLLNKKDDTYPPVDTNLSVSIELSLWRCKRCHEHSMVKFIFTRGYLIPHICVCITEQVWA